MSIGKIHFGDLYMVQRYFYTDTYMNGGELDKERLQVCTTLQSNHPHN